MDKMIPVAIFGKIPQPEVKISFCTFGEVDKHGDAIQPGAYEGTAIRLTFDPLDYQQRMRAAVARGEVTLLKGFTKFPGVITGRERHEVPIIDPEHEEQFMARVLEQTQLHPRAAEIMREGVLAGLPLDYVMTAPLASIDAAVKVAPAIEKAVKAFEKAQGLE